MTGKLALALAIPPGYATAVWPGAGIALACVLLWGYRVSPGILLGSMGVNLPNLLEGQSTLEAFGTAALIGLGAALQAVLGAWLIKRVGAYPGLLERARDVLAFFALGGPFSCMVGATMGVLTLRASGAIPPEGASFSWLTWWAGDSIGAMIVTPIVLLWSVGTPLRRRLLVTAPLLILLGLVISLFLSVRRWEERRVALELEQRTTELTDSLRKDLATCIEILDALGRFYDSTSRVEASEFRSYVSRALSHHPIQALAWVPRAGNRFPVTFIEPRDPNRKAVGFDIASEPRRRAALARARDNGTVTASQPLRLVQDREGLQSVVLFLPVYRRGAPHDTVAQRRRNLIGYATEALRIARIVDSAAGPRLTSEIGLEIRDNDQLIYRRGGPADASVCQTAITIDVAGRRWELLYSLPPQATLLQPSWETWAVLIGVSLFTGLSVAFLLILTGRTSILEADRRQIQFERDRIFALSLDLLCTASLDGYLKSVNPAFSETLGWSDQEFLAQPFLRFIHPDDRESTRAELQRLVAGAHAVRFQNRWRCRDGGYRWLSWTSAPPNAEGTLFALARDITEHKQLEHELAGARDAALETARLKSEFLATMSHEIRTPMNGVLGMANLLLDTKLSAEQLDFVQTIKSSGDGLLAIINDILDFSKIEAGKLVFEQIDFDLTPTMVDAVELLAERAREKGVELTCALDPDVPRGLRGDPGRLRQVVLNLVSNAVKFTERGSVAVRVEVDEDGSESCLLRFSVRDTGIGLTEEDRAGLFQPFSQADGSTTRRFGGTGLGLAICKQLVETMQGQIGLVSRPGRGSTFFFTARFEKLPEVALKPSAPKPELQPLATVGELKVLLAEDNPVNRKVAQRYLEKLGFTTYSVENGRQASEELARGVYDVVLMDCHMPEMDGFVATQKIRAYESRTGAARTPIIALTASAMQGDRERCLEAGMDDFVSKPVVFAELRAALERSLSVPAA